jgi:hypothetical protein
MERKLRRLGKTTEQDQPERRRIERRCPHHIAARQDRRQVKAARDHAQQHHAADQREASAPRHRQRHPRALPRFGLVLPEPDQEEG